MADSSAIDTQEAGTGLRAANQTSTNSIDAGTPASPTGTYVAGTAAALAGLLAEGVAPLTAKVTKGAVATEATVFTFDSTEDTNQQILST